MKNNLSVWKWDAGWQYYLRRPWRWFKELYWNVRHAHDRMTKGYCYLDWSNFREWFCQIAPKMLRDITDKGYGYPGVEPFEEPEKWHDWLYKMAAEIEWCSENWREEHNINEYQKEYYEQIEKHIKENGSLLEQSDEEKAAFDKWQKRELEIWDESAKRIKNALAELAEQWDRLWD